MNLLIYFYLHIRRIHHILYILFSKIINAILPCKLKTSKKCSCLIIMFYRFLQLLLPTKMAKPL